MEMWMASYLLAQIIAEERRRKHRQEPIVLHDINFDWLRPIVKSLAGLFL